jgi:predicted ATP-dependent endonuclease of OLD family
MSTKTIVHTTIKGLWGHQDISIDFHPRLNVVYGKNGRGTTTLLHILANLIEGDIDRFCYLKFDEIIVNTHPKGEIRLKRTEGPEAPTVSVYIENDLVSTVTRTEDVSVSTRKLLEERLGGKPLYLPAFRSILEAITRRGVEHSAPYSAYEKESRKIAQRETEWEHHLQTQFPEERRNRLRSDHAESVAVKTLQCREWFGRFVPVIRFPSIRDIEEQLSQEFQWAQIEVAAFDREALSAVFVQVLRAMLEGVNEGNKKDAKTLTDQIQGYLSDLEQSESEVPPVYAQIASLIRSNADKLNSADSNLYQTLSVYNQALTTRRQAQESAFKRIRLFESSLNHFLAPKSLVFELHRRAVRETMGPRVVLPNKQRASLNVLSSGERHVLSLLFSATHMSPANGIVLIDEPELSLHVDWQRIILRELTKQAGDRQIIACTHAPEVSADYDDVLVNLDMPAAPLGLSPREDADVDQAVEE